MIAQGLPIARRLVSTARVALAVFAAACGSDAPLEVPPGPPAGIVVLDGFIQPGYTFLADTGTASTKLPVGSTTEFDAGGFSLTRDTLLAVSSRGAGDLLFITDIRTNTVRRVQMPARSNPGRARLFTGTGGQSLVAVALRDSAAVSYVAITPTTLTTRLGVTGAGTCPTDVFQHGADVWIVDANSACKTNYTVQGDVRLIRVPATGSTRDTLTLAGVRGSGASAIVQGDVAYVSGGGDASFASFPYTLITPGAIAKVDLRHRRVLATRPMPAGTYGAGVKLGLDGFLYTTLYENLSTFTNRIIKMRADDLAFVPNGTTPWLSLTNSTGAEVTCGSGQADALGRLHCIANGTGSVTSLVVFNAGYVETRRVAAGQGGVDMALR